MTLPTGWSTAEVRELVDLVNGYAFKPSSWTKTGRPIIRIQNLNRPEASFNHFAGTLPEKFLVQNGDLLFAWSGTPGTSFGAHIWRGGEAWLNQHIFNVRFDERYMDKRFLRLAINQNLAEYVRAAHGGAGLAHITKGVFEQSRLLIPPLPEQRRIVAEIETQFTRLDAAVAALERARANLKRYRGAVLASAAIGVLLSGEKLEDPDNSAGGGPWQIPSGWHWATVGETAGIEKGSITDGPFGSNLKTEHYTDSGPRVIRLQNIGDGVFVDEYAHISESHFETLRKHEVRPDDLVIAALGQKPPRACVIPATVGRAIVKADCIRVRPNPELTSARFLSIVLNAEPTRRVVSTLVHGVGRPRLNLSEIKAIPVPLPPLDEQRQLIEEVERRLSVIEDLDTTISANLNRTERLRQTILEKAFAGQLVPQDLADEPAIVLLDRIRAERASAPRDRRRTVERRRPHQNLLC